MRHSYATAIAALGLLATGCDLLEPESPWTERQRALDENRQLWESADVRSYRYELTRSCFCGFAGTFTVTVIDREVAEALTEDGEALPQEALPALQTLDELFDEVQRGIDVRAFGFEVEYHPELGHPTLLDLDPHEHVSDDEVTYRAEGMVSLGGG